MQALVVEDDARQSALLCDVLADWGFRTTAVAQGSLALSSWQASQPDIVLLDLGLPDMDGLDVLQDARRQGWLAPVLLLTGRATVSDRILGLNLGADDYLLKPFDADELKARIKALLRRSPSTHTDLKGPLGTLSWEPAHQQFIWCGQPLGLTPRESALLRALFAYPNRALPRDTLLKAVFPRGQVFDDALDVVAHRLRKKLAPCGVALVTLRGLGYLLKAAT